MQRCETAERQKKGIQLIFKKRHLAGGGRTCGSEVPLITKCINILLVPYQ